MYYRAKPSQLLYVSRTDSHRTPIPLTPPHHPLTPTHIPHTYHHQFLHSFPNLPFSYHLYTTTHHQTHHQFLHHTFFKL
ncbi:class I tRNA ligase family protein, partial [Paenibacillus xylanexedens]|uniref:class I tRNA ligase family protein n=1 Tax=Paenibacillus xylanexedens TaxID=528191 RepID=UPI0011AA3305